MAADGIAGGVAEDLLRAAVEVDDPLALIDRDDRVRRDRENAGELCLRRAQLFLDALLFPKTRSQVELLQDDQ